MRFNEKELATLAAQHTCEKEGLLFFRERQEGFFRKNEGDFPYEEQRKIFSSGGKNRKLHVFPYY